MRRIRLVGVILAAATVLAVGAVAVPAIRGQAKGPDPQTRGSRSVAVAAAPGAQIFGAGGPEIGVTIRDGDKGEGVVVSDVRSESPASKAGVKSGDIIVEFDSERVRSSRQLTRLVQETPAGRSVKLVVMREGKRVDLTVTPEVHARGVWSDQLQADTDKLRQDLREGLGGYVFRYPGSDGFEILGPRVDSGLIEGLLQPGGRLGVAAQDMTPQLATYFGVKQGVLVGAVTEGSAAARAGLKAGDVITAVNDHAVNTSSDLARLVHEAGSGAELTLAIVRDRKPMTIKAKLETTTPSPRIIHRTIIV
jgi:serine protease Do